jgi:hypothetical protein
MRNMLGVCCLILLGMGLISQMKTSPSSPGGQPQKTAITPTLQSTPEQLKRAEGCKKLLYSKSGEPFWSKYGNYSSSGAYVVVKPAFYALSFDDRAVIHGVMRCVLTDGRMDNSVDVIQYEDPRTNQQIGSWSPALGLRFEQ